MATHIVDGAILKRWVRAPGPTDHKYSRGVLGLLTGSKEYPGAALLGVSAALRTGIGMVRYLGPPEVGSLVVVAHPEVVLTSGNIDACVVGSGMAHPHPPNDTLAIDAVAALGIPAVLDAGALGAAASFGPLTVLTPHSGELRVLGETLGLSGGGDDLEKARIIAAHLGQCVVVKGSITTIVERSSDMWQLPEATGWLATAGTGDALAGIMGAVFAAHAHTLLEQPHLLCEATQASALIHQRAAARAVRFAAQEIRGGPGGPITVSDLIEQIPAVIAEVLAS